MLGDNSSDLSGTLVYSGSSQGAIEKGTYDIIPDGLGGYTSSNYIITPVNGSLLIFEATAPEPPEWYDPNLPSSQLGTLMSVDMGADMRSQITARSLDDKSGSEKGLIEDQVLKVYIPEKFVSSRSSFFFPLPEKIRKQLSKSIDAEQVFLMDGTSLPSWLTYDAESKVFTANEVPIGELPLTVIIKQGDFVCPVVILQ